MSSEKVETNTFVYFKKMEKIFVNDVVVDFVDVVWTKDFVLALGLGQRFRTTFLPRKNSLKISGVAIKCNVHQSAPKFRSRTKKGAIQNGRPGRSLKSKRNKNRQKNDPPRRERKTRRRKNPEDYRRARICVI